VPIHPGWRWKLRLIYFSIYHQGNKEYLLIGAQSQTQFGDGIQYEIETNSLGRKNINISSAKLLWALGVNGNVEYYK